jgi:hypothetical protein
MRKLPAPVRLLASHLATWGFLGALAACAFPTDDSDTVWVRIDAVSTTVIRGETLILRARAAVQDSSGTVLQPGEASFDWSSSDESIATVTGNPDGSAVVRGINSGRVTIRAVARDYRNAHSGEQSIRVSNTVAIDMVTPDTVHYGEQVTISGVGLGRVDQMILGETALIPDTASFSGDPLGEGTERFWVPYPARTAHVVAIANEGFSAPADSETVVVRTNALSSPQGSLTVLNLDGPAVSADGTLFYNPALALTPEAEHVFPIPGNPPFRILQDDFHLVRSDTTRPVTIVISTSDPVVGGFQTAFSLPGDFGPDPFSYFGWRLQVESQLCKRGFLISAPDLVLGSRTATIIRSFQYTFQSGIDVRVAGTAPGRYSLRIIDGFVPADPRIAPDRFEENDFCDAADVNAVDPAKKVDPVAGFSETLTMDQPFDLDWFRFTVPPDPEGNRLFTIRTASLPLGAADSSNIGLGLESLDSLDFAVGTWTAEAHAPGSSERLTLDLPPGDYYLLVADEVGAPTPYALCVGVGNDCPLPQQALRRPEDETSASGAPAAAARRTAW